MGVVLIVIRVVRGVLTKTTVLVTLLVVSVKRDVTRGRPPWSKELRRMGYPKPMTQSCLERQLINA